MVLARRRRGRPEALLVGLAFQGSICWVAGKREESLGGHAACTD